MWKVTKQFSFEAAHSLPHLPETHKCHRLHGHSYGVTIVCRGDLIPGMSWVVDYADISAVMEPIIKRLDHQNINDVILINSTAENLAFWIWAQINGCMLGDEQKLPGLYEVHVQETKTTNVIYRPR